MMKRLHTKTNFVFFLVTLIIFTSTLAYSQGVTYEEINKQFDNAVALFNSKKYDEALKGFNKIISDYSYNSKTTASEFFKAKTHFELKQFNQFKYTADQFLRDVS